VDFKLGELWEKDIVDVLGRACGDRVAVVHCSRRVSDLELFTTTAHELLHTMGFDHTTFWPCLMAPSLSSDGGSAFLSPHNLKKLRHFHGRDDDAEFALQHFRSLAAIWIAVFGLRTPETRNHYRWLQEKLKLLESLPLPDKKAACTGSTANRKRARAELEDPQRARVGLPVVGDSTGRRCR